MENFGTNQSILHYSGSVEEVFGIFCYESSIISHKVDPSTHSIF